MAAKELQKIQNPNNVNYWLIQSRTKSFIQMSR